ncbi:hypothetical protein G7Z17_g5674 [Cylindrodendrum hubeiense]|uniref:Major facilitator superfamily (MFS) profile domain-containing protein n=1 Tax=Cylindrodendrum hubeiense TaxID=595255 RepID=A0A9P5LH36_9HYPO|nr:hypothetical protein G7Z17_g5674 [Cylindrodendrum hubeiense]
MTQSTELHNMKTHGSHYESSSGPEAALRSGQEIAKAERDMSVWENAKRHWRPMLIASVGVTSAMVSGFDVVANSASISMPSFLIYFGSMGPTGYYLPSIWTSLWTAMSALMQAFGAIANGWVTDRLGRNILQKMLSGVDIGALMAVATTYIGDVVPLKLCAPIQTGLVLFIIFMQDLALGIVRIFVPIVEESAFRNVIAIQWAVGGLSAVAWAVVPESPAWLISRGKFDAARKAMRQIYGSSNSPEDRYENLKHVIQLELEQQADKSCTSITCFQGHNLKRTMTVAFLYSTTNIGGAPLLAQNIYFLIIAGLEAVHCFDIGIGGFGLAILLVAAGGLHWATSKGVLWAIAVIMNVLISIQASTLQGAGWPIAAEVPSYHLRSKTLSIGIFAQTGTTWLFTFITPYMYNVDSGNLGAKTGFIYAGTTVFLIVCAWILVPDTTGLSTAEIDAAYETGVKPGNFHKHVFDTTVAQKKGDSEI